MISLNGKMFAVIRGFHINACFLSFNYTCDNEIGFHGQPPNARDNAGYFFRWAISPAEQPSKGLLKVRWTGVSS